MSHLVYLVKFPEREQHNIYPCYYIGSKSNCTYASGNILDKNGKLYTGSSKCNDYHRCLQNEYFIIHPLKWFDDYENCLEYERMVQEKHDAPGNIMFFNKSLAQECNFHDPSYATFRNTLTGKIARLPRSHPGVLSGDWVGVTQGMCWYTDGHGNHSMFVEGQQPPDWVKGRDESLKMCGEDNPFYGKTHTQETREKIKENQQKWRENNPQADKEIRQQTSERISKLMTDKPKSTEQRRKMGRKGLVPLKNIYTHETVRIPKEQQHYYDPETWKSPYAVNQMNQPQVTCPHCGKQAKQSSSMSKWHFANCKWKVNV